MCCSRIRRSVGCVALIWCVSVQAQAAPFPDASLPGVDIGGSLSSNYEPSGAVWHPSLQSLFVVGDNGKITQMDRDGSVLQDWSRVGNWECITVANPSSPFLYLGNESTGQIREFNFMTGVMGRSFNVSSWLNGTDNQGMEALTFVPDAADPEGGLFYAGLQRTGEVFAFRLPIKSSTTSTSVSHVGAFTPVSGRTDLSDLTYDWSTKTLYAIWDTSNFLRHMQTDGTLIEEWSLPGSNQEGVAIGNGSLFIAEDNASLHQVMRYDHFASVPEPSSIVLSLVGILAVVAGARPRLFRVSEAGQTAKME